MKAFLASCGLFLLLTQSIGTPYRRIVSLLRPAPGKIVSVNYITVGGYSDVRVCDYLSPDGKYMAHITREEGEGGYFPGLSIYEYHAKKRNRDTGDGMEPAVANFVWLPHHPHTLVVACDSSGDWLGALLLWRGPGKTITYYQNKDVSDDNFSIMRVSIDGRTLFYKRYGMTHLRRRMMKRRRKYIG